MKGGRTVRVLQDFIDRVKGVGDVAVLRDIFRSAMEEIGFRYCTYHITKVAGWGGHYFVTTYPDGWVRHYAERNYVSIDPVVIYGPRHQLPFTWQEVARPEEMTALQRQIFKEAAEVGIIDGMSIPIHGRNGEYAGVALVPDGDSHRARMDVVNSQRHLAHLYSLYYHNHTSSHLLESYLKRERPRLTPREREVLTWVARGKSSWEVSTILSVSERTVLYHIENAKRKLDVSSRTHLVVKALMANLINP